MSVSGVSTSLECLVLVKDQIHSMGVVERIALIIVPLIFSYAFLPIHKFYKNEFTRVLYNFLLPYGLACAILNAVTQFALWKESLNNLLIRYKIDFNSSLQEIFNKSISLKEDVERAKKFEAASLVPGILGLCSLIVLCLYDKKPHKSLALLAISSIGMLILGYIAYTGINPNLNDIHTHLNACITVGGNHVNQPDN